MDRVRPENHTGLANRLSLTKLAKKGFGALLGKRALTQRERLYQEFKIYLIYAYIRISLPLKIGRGSTGKTRTG